MWTPPIQTLNHEHRPSKEISSTLLLVGLVNLLFFIYVLAVPFSRQYSIINKVFIADIKVTSHHCSKFSNLSNWKEEA